MRPYGIRLLVALLTFGVGVAAASLLGLGHTGRCGRRVVVDTPVFVAAPLQDDAPAPRACNYIVSGGLLNGKAVSKPQPVYPPVAKAAGVRGTVVVKVVLDENGGVAEAEAVSGPPVLRDAAVEAARRALFSPTYLSGQLVKVSGVITYNFVLE